MEIKKIIFFSIVSLFFFTCVLYNILFMKYLTKERSFKSSLLNKSNGNSPENNNPTIDLTNSWDSTSIIGFLSQERGTKSIVQSKSNDNHQEEFKSSINLTNVRDLPNTRETSLWPDDPECNKFKVGFGSEMPLVWLASFPRSGNSWTRYLIEAATGIYTNSVYKDSNMVKLGYYGEREKVNTGRCIVTKTHREWKRTEDKTVPTILLIRNPATSIVSFWNWNNAPQNIRFFFSVKNESYKTKGFRRWVKEKIRRWSEITEDRLLKSTNLLVVVYEELRDNPITQVQRILEFLGLQQDPARIACLTKYIDGNAKGHQRQIDPYTDAEKEELKAAIEVIARGAKLHNITLPDYVHSLNIDSVED